MSKNVVIISKYFNWGGGIDFIHLLSKCLILVKDQYDINLHLLVPEQESELIRMKKYLKSYVKILYNLFKGRSPVFQKPDFYKTDAIINGFKDIESEVNIVYHKNSNKGLLGKLKEIDADVILAIPEEINNNDIPWIGYIPDFQHKYYPQFFSTEECQYRDQKFEKLLDSAKAVIVNAKAVKEDIKRFYPESNCRIFNFPFTPIVELDWFEDDRDFKVLYNLPNLYFVISNQFWVHKSHITAFKALKILKEQYEVMDVHIVCTGETYDYRFPNYFKELTEEIKSMGLEDYIHFLGYIPKEDVIAVMKNSIAVLQPTLFEGGPGGGAIYNAVALGIPSVVSDIPVNKEIEDDTVFFFKSESELDMASKMMKVLNESLVREDKDSLIQKGNIRMEKMGHELLKSITYIDENYK